MISSILWQTFFIMLVGIAQVSFLSTWPRPVSTLNLVLSVVIFVAVMLHYRMGITWAVAAGFFLELYSALPFGFTVTGIVLTVMAVNFIFQNFLTILFKKFRPK